MRNRSLGHVIVLLFGILISIGIAETVSYVLLQMEFNGVSNRSETQHKLAGKASAETVTLELMTDTHGSNILHPYWGFAINRDKVSGVNRLGLVGPEPPTVTDERKVAVALLGGSVALELGAHKQALLSALQRVEHWKDKEILLLPYGVAGGKQPQQLLQLTYLLSLGYHIDAVINLDGFNELTLPLVDNIPYHVALSFPRNWRLYSRLGLDAKLSRMMYEANKLESERLGLKAAFSIGLAPSSNTALLVYNLLDQRKTQRFQALNQQIQQYADNQQPGFQTSGPFEETESMKQQMTQAVSLWQRSSIQLDRLCTANGIDYYHFLQPNQYLKDSKPMGPEEAKLALRSDHPYGKVARVGYSLLVQGGKDLLQAGVHYHDLTMIFQQENEPMYKDSCCHFNEQGYQRIADAIAAAISKFEKK